MCSQPPEDFLANLADDNEDIRVSVHGTGNLVPTANQLADYPRRGAELDDVCVWDFISRVDKVPSLVVSG